MSAALERLTIGKRADGVPVLRETITAQELDTLLTDAPALDMQPVVRCRDCRHWRQEIDRTTHWVCVQHSMGERLMYTTPDFYCADGARMDAEEGTC